MSKKLEKNILKGGDLAYYTSLYLFPKSVRDDVSKLYSFVHVVGGLSVSDEPDIESFKYIVRRWQNIKRRSDLGKFRPVDDSPAERVLANIVYIIHRYDCDVSLVDSYLKSVAAEFRPKNLVYFRDTLAYINGSAESIGVLIAKIMGLPNASLHFAKVQARSFKLLNILRNIDSDLAQGRSYLANEEMKKFGLDTIDETAALKHPNEYKKFIKFQIKRYRTWQREAEKGLQFVPRRMRAGIKTAIDSYSWIAKKIDKDPYLVFEKHIRPKRNIVVRKSFKNTVMNR